MWGMGSESERVLRKLVRCVDCASTFKVTCVRMGSLFRMVGKLGGSATSMLKPLLVLEFKL